jgi:hypothetical protein
LPSKTVGRLDPVATNWADGIFTDLETDAEGAGRAKSGLVGEVGGVRGLLKKKEPESAGKTGNDEMSIWLRIWLAPLIHIVLSIPCNLGSLNSALPPGGGIQAVVGGGWRTRPQTEGRA